MALNDQPPAFDAARWGFPQAVRLLEAAINYEKVTAYKYDAPTFNLDRVRALLRAVGSPEERLRAVHIAGTKGKGTTSALIAAILTATGHRTGLFTSPHVLSVTERIMIDGRPISEQSFAERVLELRDLLEWQRLADLFTSPTYFEILTAVGFRHFEVEQVSFAVVEVGLGGRLDSTNVLSPLVAVVTSIGWDHMDKLGRTIDAIAGEKAGIMKPGSIIVIGPQRYRRAEQALLRRADEVGREVLCYGRDFAVTQARPLPPAAGATVPAGWEFSVSWDHPWLGRGGLPDLRLGLLGRHQVGNAATAIAACLALQRLGAARLSGKAVADGLAGLRWPARVHFVPGRPAMVIDAAHTIESAEALVDALRLHIPGRRRWYVFACSGDKDAAALLRTLAADAFGFVLTAYGMPRAAAPERLALALRRVAGRTAAIAATSRDALAAVLALAAPDDVIVFSGSFFLAAEVYRLLAERGVSCYPWPVMIR